MKRSLAILSMLLCSLAVSAATNQEDNHVKYGDEFLVQVAVSDLSRSIEFYSKTLELELELQDEELGWAKFRLPTGARLGIGESDRVEGSGTTSLNISVRDIDAAKAELERRGVEFPGPIIDIPGVVRLADFQDPDGNRIRLAGAPRPAASP